MSGVREVWKFTEAVQDVIGVTVPHGANLLKVADQSRDGVTLDFWMEVDPYEDRQTRYSFMVVGTGRPILHPGEYLDSVVTLGGRLVWHVYLLEKVDVR